jgi:diguanylate cyclase (GGDEF)-like protein
MYLVRDVMWQGPVSAGIDSTVLEAVELLRRNHVEIVPVLEGGRVVGCLDALTLSRFDGQVSLREVVGADPAVTVEAIAPLSDAASLMREHRLRQLPVVDEGRLVGILSDRDLLSVWGAANDPLTGLPVQHRLRHWMAMRLSEGREVAVLFADLNDFGFLNKQRGHVFGDHALAASAQSLQKPLDRRTDFACRYGGDEFAVATTRTLEETAVLAGIIREAFLGIRIQGEPAPIQVSIGISGGQRVAVREGTHVEAMIDDLLTLASAASTQAKTDAGGIAFARSAPQASEDGAARGPLRRVILDGYQIGQSGARVEVTVRLRHGRRAHELHCHAEENQTLRALVTATVQCLQALSPRRAELWVEETYEYTTPRGVTCVGATVGLRYPDGATERLVGASPVGDDVHRTYINAVLDATNRRLARS